jgi:hypothetical protein
MEKEIFSTQGVGDFYNKNFICIKLDAEKGWGKTFAQRNKVTSYPTYIFFSTKGQITLVTVGSMAIYEFMDIGKRALKNEEEGIYLESVSVKNSDSIANVGKTLNYIKKLSPLGKPNALLIETYLKSLPVDSLNLPSTLFLITLNYDGSMPTNGLAFKVLYNAYKKYPVKSKELMSPWSTLANKLKNGIDSAGANHDKKQFKDLLAAFDLLEPSQFLAERENNYLQCRYDYYAGDKQAFLTHFRDFVKKYILTVDSARLYEADRQLFAAANQVKYHPADAQTAFSAVTPTQFKVTFFSETERTYDDFYDLADIYQHKLQNKVSSHTLPIDEWKKRAYALYSNNPIFFNKDNVMR